jgi:hypothetical protein
MSEKIMSDRKEFCQQCGACPNAGDLKISKKPDDQIKNEELEPIIEEITKRVLEEIQKVK